MLPIPNVQDVRYDPLSTVETQAMRLHRLGANAILLYLELVHRAGRLRFRTDVRPSTLARELLWTRPQVSRSLAELAAAGMISGVKPWTFLPLRACFADHSDPYLRELPNLVTLEPKSAGVTGSGNSELPDLVTPFLIEQRREQEKGLDMSPPPVESNGLTSLKARNIVRDWVDRITSSRAVWPPKYKARSEQTREQAIRNGINLLLRQNAEGRPVVTVEELEEVVAWACEHYFPIADVPYRVTNVFGQLERWKDLRTKMYGQQVVREVVEAYARVPRRGGEI